MKFTTILAASASIAAMLGAGVAQAQSLEELAAAATEEGRLSTIALPRDWCNYGAMIDGFLAKYPGIEYNGLNPDAGSADELEAIRANMNNTGPRRQMSSTWVWHSGRRRRPRVCCSPIRYHLGFDSRRCQGP